MNNSKLLSLKVSNYRSFYREQEIVFGGKNSREVTAIYGPNSSGKSNIAKALMFMKWFIANSASANIINLPHDPFLLREGSDHEPSRFEIEFTQKSRRYKYTFSINANRIAYEELREFSPKTAKTKLIFTRYKNRLNISAEKYGFGKRLFDNTREGTLLITKARENNNEYANLLFEWFDSLNILTGEKNETLGWVINNLKGNTSLKKNMQELLIKSDFWIRGFNIESITIPEEAIASLPLNEEVKRNMIIESRQATAIKTLHALRNKDLKIVGERYFDLESQESSGTSRFFMLAGPIIDTLNNGKILYIDEFGSHLHPDICNFIVSLFKSKHNKSGAQLIINTHDTSLMSGDALTRDEIILVEKSYGEESVVSPLNSKSVRESESFEKRYRQGIYGAKPQIEWNTED